MAKAFDDNERKLIKDKLKEGALLFIQQQGVRKTSVDELVKYANISKGFHGQSGRRTIAQGILSSTKKFIPSTKHIIYGNEKRMDNHQGIRGDLI